MLLTTRTSFILPIKDCHKEYPLSPTVDCISDADNIHTNVAFALVTLVSYVQMLWIRKRVVFFA